MKLRFYQQKGVDDIRRAYQSGYKAPLFVMPTGSGKTVVFAHIAATSAAKGKRVLILVHRIELIRQTAAKLRDAGVRVGLINPMFSPDPSAPVQVASVQTMVKRLHLFGVFDLIITDECFVPGTVIDGRPIETLRPGDVVTAYNETTGEFEPRHVVRIFKSEHKGPLYRISTGENEIICTGNHPILTPGGWVNADEITTKTKILIYEPLQNLREPDEWKTGNMLRNVSQNSKFNNDEPNKQGLRIGEDENKQPNGKGGGPAKNGKNAPGNKTQTENSGRKRSWAYRATSGIAYRIAKVLRIILRGIHLSYQNGQIFGLSEPLQNRHRITSGEDGSRNRRLFTHGYGKTKTRCQKGGISNWKRVDSVKVYKFGSDEWNDAMRGESFVYNFETDGLHTYIAGGIVVHNCHHIISTTYRTILNAYPTAWQLGVTATPIRGDGKGLGQSDGGVFDSLILGPNVSELIGQGHLVRPVIYAPRERMDFSDVRTRMGDYDKAEIERRMDKPKITGDAVKHYRDLCSGQPSVWFCISVAHAQHVAEEFRQAGYRAAAVDGKMDDTERGRILGGLATGEVEVVTSCDLISEGTDIPAIACAGLLRPTQSLGLYLQQVGRALRPAPGKDRAIILDHVGNVLTHGLPDEVRAWTLEGEHEARRTKKEKAEAPIRVHQCENCYAVFEAFKMICPECGHVRIVKGRDIERADGELVELTDWHKLQLQRQKRQEVGRAKTLEELEKIAAARGYKKGWARWVFNSRQH